MSVGDIFIWFGIAVVIVSVFVFIGFMVFGRPHDYYEPGKHVQRRKRYDDE